MPYYYEYARLDGVEKYRSIATQLPHVTGETDVR